MKRAMAAVMTAVEETLQRDLHQGVLQGALANPNATTTSLPTLAHLSLMVGRRLHHCS
uniref:Uncharacterized protein n=1 Tax=mine drainage metagenome TaxID=410659 RepID=E6PKU0_9ZZZZ